MCHASRWNEEEIYQTPMIIFNGENIFISDAIHYIDETYGDCVGQVEGFFYGSKYMILLEEFHFCRSLKLCRVIQFS